MIWSKFSFDEQRNLNLKRDADGKNILESASFNKVPITLSLVEYFAKQILFDSNFGELMMHHLEKKAK